MPRHPALALALVGERVEELLEGIDGPVQHPPVLLLDGGGRGGAGLYIGLFLEHLPDAPGGQAECLRDEVYRPLVRLFHQPVDLDNQVPGLELAVPGLATKACLNLLALAAFVGGEFGQPSRYLARRNRSLLGFLGFGLRPVLLRPGTSNLGVFGPQIPPLSLTLERHRTIPLSSRASERRASDTGASTSGTRRVSPSPPARPTLRPPPYRVAPGRP